MFVYDLKSAWCERERAKLRQFLDLLESGKVGTHEVKYPVPKLHAASSFAGARTRHWRRRAICSMRTNGDAEPRRKNRP